MASQRRESHASCSHSSVRVLEELVSTRTPRTKHVSEEVQERRAIRIDAAVRTQAVDDSSHRVLAHTIAIDRTSKRERERESQSQSSVYECN